MASLIDHHAPDAQTGPRYVVRYRLGGRAYPLVHGGSFKTLKEAKARRDLVAGELAAGRNPADVLRAMVETPIGAHVRATGPRRTGRAASTSPTRRRKNIGSHLKAMLADVRRPRPGDDHPGRRAGVDRAA